MDSRKKNQDFQTELFGFVAITLTLSDIVYFVAIYLTSSRPWLSLGLAVLFPAVNVPALKIALRTGVPYHSYTLLFTLIPMFLVTYFSGPGSAAWLMCFSGIFASHVMCHDERLKKGLIIGFIAAALLGSYGGGSSIAQLGIISVALASYALVSTRIFSFMQKQNDKLGVKITKQKQAEHELTEQKALLQEILDNIDQAIILFDADQRLVTWNKHFPDTVMLEEGEGKGLYKGRKALHLASDLAERGIYGPGDPLQLAAERIERLMEGMTGTDISFGDERRYDVRSTRLPDGGVVASYTDITERKKAQRERDEAFEVITSSIRYASRIQRSVLPPGELIEEIFDDHFILWKPRDVVGGDIFWCKEWGSGTVLSLADCTGHGVPGAFITLISSGALERAMLEVPEGDPAALITRMHQMIQVVLGQDTASGEADDGLELGICYIHPDREWITYAGAGFPLFVVDGATVEVIKGDRGGIGYRRVFRKTNLTNHEVRSGDGFRFYLTSDGLIDQLGGEKRRSFGKKRFKQLIAGLNDVPLSQHGEKIYETLLSYQGDEKRRDDVSVIGFKI